MTEDQEIGGLVYRIVRERYRNWRIRILRGECRSISSWVESPSGRPRHWKTQDAAQRYLDSLKKG